MTPPPSIRPLCFVPLPPAATFCGLYYGINPTTTRTPSLTRTHASLSPTASTTLLNKSSPTPSFPPFETSFTSSFDFDYSNQFSPATLYALRPSSFTLAPVLLLWFGSFVFTTTTVVMSWQGMAHRMEWIQDGQELVACLLESSVSLTE